jgi:peptide/nickel transport system permease protein
MRNRSLLLGLGGLAILLALALFGPALAPHDPIKTQAMVMKGGQFVTPPFAPGAEYPFGTDKFGRDVLSGLLAGTRYTLSFVLLAAGMAALVAIPLGLVAGWRGRLTGGLTRTLATALSTLPSLFLAGLLLRTVRRLYPDLGLLGQVLLNAGVMGLLMAPRLAEQIRLLTSQVKGEPYIEGAVAAGATGARILRRHLLPNLTGPLLILFLTEVAATLRLLALLGIFKLYLAPTQRFEYRDGEFLYLPAVPDWTSYIEGAFNGLRTSWWTILFPGLMLTFAILAFSLTADGLRQRWTNR